MDGQALWAAAWAVQTDEHKHRAFLNLQQLLWASTGLPALEEKVLPLLLY